MAQIIDDLNHPDMHKIIKQLKLEPCLYNPETVYYKNQKKRNQAYKRIAVDVNLGSSRVYTENDIMENVKNLRKEYRKLRNYQMKEFSRKKKLPEAPKWWIMLYSFVKDENQLINKAESAKESRRTLYNKIKRYLRAEKEYISELSSEESEEPDDEESEKSNNEDAGTDEEDSDSSIESPLAKKSKTTNENNTARSAKIIEHISDLEADMIIQKLYYEPLLCDPKHVFYKNKKERQEAYQRIANKMNADIDDLNFTAADVEANLDIIRNEYRYYRQMRIRRYALRNKVPSPDKWWRNLYYLLSDETLYPEKLCVHKPLTKAQVQQKYNRLVGRYKKHEVECLDGNQSYEDDDDYETDEEILEQSSCNSRRKKFCFKRLSK